MPRLLLLLWTDRVLNPWLTRILAKALIVPLWLGRTHNSWIDIGRISRRHTVRRLHLSIALAVAHAMHEFQLIALKLALGRSCVRVLLMTAVA